MVKRGPLEALNDTKLILNDYKGHSCSFRTNLVSIRTFRCPQFPKQFLGWDFFCRFIQQTGSSAVLKMYSSINLYCSEEILNVFSLIHIISLKWKTNVHCLYLFTCNCSIVAIFNEFLTWACFFMRTVYFRNATPVVSFCYFVWEKLRKKEFFRKLNWAGLNLQEMIGKLSR